MRTMTVMMTSTSVKISAGLVLLAVLLSAAKCETERSGSVKTDRAPADRAVDPRKVRTVTIRASIRDKKGIPGEVAVDVSDGNGGHESSQEILTVAGGEYRQTVTYTTGTQLNVHVEVRPAVPQTGAQCVIVDGVTTVQVGPESAGWRAVCDLTTSQ